MLLCLRQVELGFGGWWSRKSDAGRSTLRQLQEHCMLCQAMGGRVEDSCMISLAEEAHFRRIYPESN